MDFSKFWLKNKIVAFQGRACSSTFLHMIAVCRRLLQPDRGMGNVAETTQGAWKMCKKHSRKVGSCSDMIMPMYCQAFVYQFH